jgi:rare lipoprotein A
MHPMRLKALFKRFAMRYGCGATIACSLALIASCGSRGARSSPPLARTGTHEEGIASWYGEPYHGRRAANGEIYDMHRHTAAHTTLPFETWVRVRRLDNGRSTEVRIIDRGPFARGRIIDLSHAAAADLDLLLAGISKVRLTIIDPPRDYLRQHRFTVQVSSSRVKTQAEALGRQLASEHKNVEVRYRKPNPEGGHPESWRVLVGREDKWENAQRLLRTLQGRFANAFLIPWDAE